MQGITIVTIQPEFKQKDPTKPLVAQCLFGCQSNECAPKTCCSMNALDSVVTKADKLKRPKIEKSKNSKNSGSLLSLNVSSLAKFRKSTSTPNVDGMKKSVSESHVGQIVNDDSEASTCNSSQAVNLNSTVSSDEVNNEINIPIVVDVIKEQNEVETQNLIVQNDGTVQQQQHSNEESALNEKL